jgi:hypothetical protein
VDASSGAIRELPSGDNMDLTGSDVVNAGVVGATSLTVSGQVTGVTNLGMSGTLTGGTDITISGELAAATLDVSGNIDVDGMSYLDAVDIDGATQIDATVSVGVDDTGYDVKFFGATSGKYMLWDEDADALLVSGSLNVNNSPVKVAGLETIYVPAAAMYPNTTNGASDLEQVELSNGPELKCLDFAAAADDFAQFTVIFPKSWNEGTVTFQPFWTVTGTDTGTVAWALSGVSFADNASIDQAFGTQVVATAKAFSGTSNDMTVSAVSGAVTITNAAVDTQTYFQISRDVSADSQTGDARLLGIKLFFTTDAANDA